MSMTCRLATLSKLWTTTLNRSAGMGGGALRIRSPGEWRMGPERQRQG